MRCLKCESEILGELTKYGLHPDCFTQWFDVDTKLEFVNLTQHSSNERSSGENASPHNTSFYHGKFKKYSTTLGSQEYILKMRDEKEAPELPEVEYLCNQIAHSLHLPVADYYYIDFYGQKVFVTKVFIGRSSGLENLEHIYKYRDNSKHDCENLARVIQNVTKRPQDLEIFYATLLFDALIGNHDRHGRNLAFITSSKNTVLSPIYDNVSYLSLVSGPMLAADFNPTGRIATAESKEPSMLHYAIELKRLDQGQVLNTFAKRVNIKTIEKIIDGSFCSNPMKKAMKQLILKRHKELLNALQN